MIVGGWGAASDSGRVRPHNEDSFLADPPLFVVADGMGGHMAGEVASRLAVDQFSELIGRADLTANETITSLLDANTSILEEAKRHPEKSGMGTTLAGLAVITAAGSEHWLVFNVGDSRVYRLFEGHLSQLTVDHSEVQERVAAGQMTPEEARTSSFRNIVTRSLGTEPAPVPDSWVFPPEAGERFVICSDGLTTELADEDIQSCMGTIEDPQAAAQELVDRAVNSGGRDNVSVIVVDTVIERPESKLDVDTAPRGSHGG